MDFQNLYVLDKEGKILYSHENSDKNDPLTDLNVLKTLEKLAKEFGGDVKTAELGDFKYFEMRDELTGIQLVIKSKKDMNDDFIRDLLTSIKNTFVNLFTQFYTLTDEEQDQKWKAFREKVNEQIEKMVMDSEDFLSKL